MNVDGQRKPKPEPVRLELLDAIGFERKMSPAPLVKEGLSMQDWYRAGGWVKTIPGVLA